MFDLPSCILSAYASDACNMLIKWFALERVCLAGDGGCAPSEGSGDRVFHLR